MIYTKEFLKKQTHNDLVGLVLEFQKMIEDTNGFHEELLDRLKGFVSPRIQTTNRINEELVFHKKQSSTQDIQYGQEVSVHSDI
mgnify:CR=1 FL=1